MNRVKQFARIAWILGAFLVLGLMPLHAASNPRAFSKFFDEVIKGDLAVIGNTVLGEQQGAQAQCPASNTRNGDIVAKLFEESSATLSLPTGFTIRKAFLYWQGTTVELAKANEIYLRSPGSATFQKITSQNNKFNYHEITQESNARYAYQGVADVTQYVTGEGIYTIKNLKTMEGQDKPLTDESGDSGYHGGWALAVVYESPGEAVRQIMLYDGFKEIKPSKTQNTAKEQIVVDGFKVPDELPPDSHLYLFVGGADKRIGSSDLKVRFLQDHEDRPLSSPRTGSVNHIFDSYISGEREPQCTNNLGTDIHHYNIGRSGANIVRRNFTKKTTTLTSSYRQIPGFPQKVGDVFYPGFLGFTINRIGNLAPNLCYLENFAKRRRASETRTKVFAGEIVKTSVTVLNNGEHSGTAENLTIKRLKSGNHAPFTYEANTLGIGATPSSFIAQTDSSGDDMAENLSSYLRFRLGNGANATKGGSLAGNKEAYFTYTVRLNDDALLLNSSGGYKVSYTSGSGSVVDEILPPCNPSTHILAIKPKSPSGRPKVQILEYDKSWNQSAITTKVSGKPIKIKFMVDPRIDENEVITIKKVGIYSYDYGTTPQSVMSLSATGDPKLSKNTPTFEPPPFMIESAHRHLRIHATLADGTLIVSDSFAVRPESFGISVSQPPKAGEDFILTISALNHQGNPTQGYNNNIGFVHTGDIHTSAPHPSMAHGTTGYPIYSVSVAYHDPKYHEGGKPRCLSGAFTHNDGDDLSVIQAGRVTPRHFKDGVQSMRVSYPYTGVIRVEVKEIPGAHWSGIDSTDGIGEELPYIRSYSKDIAVGAYKFGFKDLTLVSKTNGNFTYFENLDTTNDKPDLLKLSYVFYAADKKGNKLENYRPDCYAKSVVATYAWDRALQNTNNLKVFYAAPDGTIQAEYLQAIPNPDDPSQNITPINFSFFIKSTKFADSDSSRDGTHKLQRGEAKVELPLGFSASRDKPVNPIRLTDANHKLKVKLVEAGDPSVSARGSVTSNLNLMYGRINAINSSLDSQASVARVYYEVYCKSEGGVKCEDFGFHAENRSVNSAYWYRRFPDIDELPAVKLLANKIESEQPPTSITLEETGDKRYYKLQFSPAKGATKVPIRIKHGNGADKIPSYLYFHPYKPYTESASFTSFSVSRPNDGTAGDVGIVKTEDVRDKKGASRISR